MKCPYCEYEYEYAYRDEEKGVGDEDFFAFKKGGCMTREKWAKSVHQKERMDLYGCPKCMKAFMG